MTVVFIDWYSLHFTRCSTDRGSTALLSKHARSDRRIKGKTARQLNSEFEAILGRKKKRFLNLEQKKIGFRGYSQFFQANTRKISCSYSRLLPVHYHHHKYTNTVVGKQHCSLDAVQ
jgi:hypothetical protein